MKETRVKEELEYLVILNDIELLIDDLGKGTDAIEEELGFDVSRRGHLEEARERTRGKCHPDLLRRYDRIRKKYGRVIAPVFDGICYGCFQRLPTQLAQENRNEETLSCPHCGRFLYFMR
jgi:predicted  nucleic acid-binding Zn-ribbon protein